MRITTRTITTNYELCGPEQAPVAMLSHSLASGMSMWDPQLTALQSRFRSLLYDTRGTAAAMCRTAPTAWTIWWQTLSR